MRRALLLALSVSLGLARPLTAQTSQVALRFYGTGSGQQDRVRIAVDDNVSGPEGNTPADVGAGSFSIEFWLRGLLADNDSAHAGGDQESYTFNWIYGNVVADRRSPP